jgi:hypothetical protein
MEPCVQIVLSGTLTFGVPLLYAVHELVAMRRWRDDPGDDPAREPPPTPPRTEPGKPLPACLIPNLPPRPATAKPARTLELV